jgi:putative peptidoglycan lipid II flippase
MSETRSVVSSAKLIAVCTLLSRITGLIREILLAQSFGLKWVLDAFNYGFQVPNLFRRLLGEGAMSAVFVPTFTQMLENESRQAAWRLLARTLALLSLALIAIVIVLEGIVLAIWHFAPAGDAAEQASRHLLLWLTALMLPFMLTICIVALLAAILNCVGSFVPAALTPVLLNIGMIVGIAWLGPRLHPGDKVGQATVVGWMVIISGFAQVLVLLPVLRATGVRLGWSAHFRDPAVMRMLRLLLPVALGQGVLAVGVFLDAQVCVLLTHKAGTPDMIPWLGGAVRYPLEEGAWSAVTVAQRLYQFPLGVLVVSLGTAAMPAFSRLAARQDWRAWSHEIRQ